MKTGDKDASHPIRKKLAELAPRAISGLIVLGILAIVATHFPGLIGGEKHLYLFLGRQAGWDGLGIAYLACTVWLATRQGAWKELNELRKPRSWVQGRSGRWFIILGLAIWTTLGVDVYFLARARYHFWRYWGGKAYALDELDAVAKLSERGRLESAKTLLDTISNSLDTSDYQNIKDYRLYDIEARLSRSRSLSEGNLSTRAGTWNPVGGQQTYFQLAEAVRGNAQNFQAAERLTSMLRTLHRDVIPKDIGQLCVPQEDLRFWSLSSFDGKVWGELLHAGYQGFSCSREQQDRLLKKLWAIDEVECILSFSRQAMTPLNPYRARRLDRGELSSCEIQESETADYTK